MLAYRWAMSTGLDFRFSGVSGRLSTRGERIVSQLLVHSAVVSLRSAYSHHNYSHHNYSHHNELSWELCAEAGGAYARIHIHTMPTQIELVSGSQQQGTLSTATAPDWLLCIKLPGIPVGAIRSTRPCLWWRYRSCQPSCLTVVLGH